MKALNKQMALITITASLFVSGADASKSNSIPLDLDRVKKVQFEEVSSIDVAKFIPTDMKQGSEASAISDKIFNNCINAIANYALASDTVLGETASAVKNALSTDIDLVNEAHEISHSVNFEVDPIKQSALLKYEGLVDGNLKYDSADKEYTLELSKKISKDSDVKMSHNAGNSQSNLLVSISW